MSTRISYKKALKRKGRVSRKTYNTDTANYRVYIVEEEGTFVIRDELSRFKVESTYKYKNKSSLKRAVKEALLRLGVTFDDDQRELDTYKRDDGVIVYKDGRVVSERKRRDEGTEGRLDNSDSVDSSVC